MNHSVDWRTIKAEYIAGGISYRKLAEKYGVSFSTLSRMATREKWTDLMRQTCDKSDTVLANLIGRKNAKKSAKIDDLADKLLDKIGEVLEKIGLNGKEIKNIASALKDVKDIKGIKDKLDVKEQKARIAKLQKETKEGVAEQMEIAVTFGLDEEKSKWAE